MSSPTFFSSLNGTGGVKFKEKRPPQDQSLYAEQHPAFRKKRFIDAAEVDILSDFQARGCDDCKSFSLQDSRKRDVSYSKYKIGNARLKSCLKRKIWIYVFNQF